MLGFCLRMQRKEPRFTDLTSGFAIPQFQAVFKGLPNQFFSTEFFQLNKIMSHFIKKYKCHHGSTIVLPLVKEDSSLV